MTLSLIPQPQEVALGGGGVEVTDRNAFESRIDEELPREGYTLDITTEGGVRIVGGSAAGVFYGTQTLHQLLPPSSYRHAATGPWQVPAMRISDSPRFRWRGVMLDVARHFMPLPDVLRFIDSAAFHKLNIVHLHLTDDQGWRIAVPGWPLLTEIGAWRKRTMIGASIHGLYDARPHGGFYTADDLREMVAFAAQRHVTLVPEIDMPGHMQAAVSAYPELGNGGEAVPVMEEWGVSTHVLNVEERTLDFCRTVLDFLCDIFPGKYIGIGGDECPHDEWKASDSVQLRMAELGLRSETALHGWFVQQMAVHLRNRGRYAYGWDEIVAADSTPLDVLIAAWRGAKVIEVAVSKGFEVIACPAEHIYLDYRQSEDNGEPTPVHSLLTLEDVYGFEPVPVNLTEAQAKRVVGAQANVWTEHMETAQRVEYMTYPRLCAFSEVVWGKTSGSSYGDFETRLIKHLERLDAMAVNYRPLSGPRPWDSRPDAPGKPRARRGLVGLTAADVHLQ